MPNEIGIKRTKEPTLAALDLRQTHSNRYLDAVQRHVACLTRGEYREAEILRMTLEPLRETMEQACRRFNDRYPLA